MIRAKHFFWHLIKSIVGASIALMLALCLWILSTESGLNSLASMLSQQVSGQMRYNNLSGTLLSHVHLDELELLQQDGSKITINELDATPQLSQLIFYRVAFSTLNAKQLTIMLPSHASQELNPQQEKDIKQAISVPELQSMDFPSIAIGKMAIQTIMIKSDQYHDHTFENTTLSSQYHDNDFIYHFQTENALFHHLKVNGDLKGTLENYTLALDITNDYVKLPIQGSGNTQSLSLTLPHTETEAGTLDFDASYQFSLPSLKGHAEGTAIDLEKLNPYYQGLIDIDLNINLNHSQGSIKLNHLSGTYFQQKIDANFDAKTNFKTLTALDLRASLAEDKLFVSYDRQKGILIWSANINQLASLLPNQSGKIITQGKFTPTALHASLTGSDLTLAQWPFTSLQMNLEGMPSDHDFQAKWSSSETNWTANCHGKLEDHDWFGSLDTLNMQTQETAPWTLQKPVSLTLIDGALRVNTLCWKNLESQICASGEWNTPTYEHAFQFKADNISLEKWSHLFWKDIQLKGLGNAEGILQQKTDTDQRYPEGELTVHLEQASLLNERNEPLTSPFDEALLHAQLTDSHFDGKVDIAFDEDKPLKARFSIPHLIQSKTLSEQVINASINWETQALQWLAFFDFSKPSGDLDIDLNASGRWGNPVIKGAINLKNGQWAIPWLNIQLINTELSIIAQGDEAKIKGEAQSGDGVLHVDGNAHIDDGALTSQMNLTGENITIENTPNLMLVVSPNLILSSSNQSLRITGDAQIPTGEIRFQDFSNTIELPEDMTFTHEENFGLDNGTFSHHIALTLGEKVAIDTYGIKGQLSGNLILHKLPYRNTMVDGQLHLHKGTYSTSYGINLAIERGILNYTNSPFSSPWLSMTATRTVEKDVPSALPVPDTVGISLSGPFTHLKTDYFARPEGIANQQQILAYLISGRSSGISNAGSNGLVFNALQAYVNNTIQSTDATQQGTLGYTMKSIKESFNLNEFTLDLFTQDPFSDSNNLEDSYTSLHIGKRLSPKLYARSNIGMPIGSLTLIYQLAKRWSIQVSSSYGWSHESHPLETGADLFYNF